MHKMRNEALTFAGAVLLAALFVSAVGIIESGLPKSVMQAAQLYAGSVFVVLFLACVMYSRAFRMGLFGLLPAMFIAVFISAAIRPMSINGWVLTGVSVGLGIVLVWSLNGSALVRRWFFGALVLSLVYPVVVIMLPQMPTLSMRLLVGLVIAGPIGAWAGWRVWPAIERWHFKAGRRARDAVRAGWLHGAAAARGEMTAEEFFRRRDLIKRDDDR